MVGLSKAMAMRMLVMLLLVAAVAASADCAEPLSDDAASVAPGYNRVLSYDLVRRRFERFNLDDEDIHPCSIPNDAACDTIGREIPLFECPDEDIERTYYFRWWTYRKHLRKTKDGAGWVVTEFSPDVGWAGDENTISCPFGHHVREGRWIRNPRYLDSYIDFMLEKGSINGPRSYVNWPARSILDRAKVTGDFEYAVRHLDDCVKSFEAWKKGWRVTGLSLRDVPNVQGAKGVPIQAGFRADRGLFDIAGDREGSEFALSHDGARPMVNCAMWAEAKAISDIALRAKRADLVDRYGKFAEALERNIKCRLWNDKKHFFTTLSVNGEHDDVCELHGYAPFYFGMDMKGYESAWKPLMSELGFFAPKGLTFPARNTPGFDVKIDLTHHECMWNGPSWPYATSVALTALYETLQCDIPAPVSPKDFVTLLHQYAAQQVRRLPDGRTVPWIDEDLNPFTGEWTAREYGILLEKQGHKSDLRERGKDYNHSTFCDLVIAGLCGFVPEADGRTVVKPLAPESWDWWCLDGVRYHGRDVTILFDRDGTRYGRGKGLVILDR